MLLAPWLGVFKRSALDVTLTTHPGLSTRIIEKPGERLDDVELDALVVKMRDVARRTLPKGALAYGVFSGDRRRLAATIVTLVSETATGRPIAFNALALMDARLNGAPLEIMHLGLVMVDPDYRGRGLSDALYGLTVLFLFIRGGLRPRWLSNVSQAPAVIGMVSETFSNVFPSPLPQSRQSFSHLTLARQIMTRHRHVFGVGPEAFFDEARGVIVNAYTGGSDDLKKTFEAAARHRRPAFNDFCRANLDYRRGDDFLQIGHIDIAAARRYLLTHAPRGLFVRIAAEAAFVILQRFLLPVVHWFDSARPFGLLRPRRADRRG
jgi:GNAT superfamily N-acetyltransferase